ncbi:MAG: DUF349 domain-containing protein [Flavobacteriaceae bacterium]|nr:DUF349 domain-containing protein [Flavobacteriaceae bacterium]MDG1962076.1 DUF349 domain-containing protein [Flavobacteriaceae bacterium]
MSDQPTPPQQSDNINDAQESQDTAAANSASDIENTSTDAATAVTDTPIDLNALTVTELLETFKNLLDNAPIQNIKPQVEDLKHELEARAATVWAKNKAEFLASGGSEEDFSELPDTGEVDQLDRAYRKKRKQYYESLNKDLNENLSKRRALIESFKGLLAFEENINTTLKSFKALQEEWHTAGPIPKAQYEVIWSTYRHHVENFYDFLDLNREFRDLDFKHNLEQKIKIVERAQELSALPDVTKAFNELQQLHKMWKEDLGPVAKEYREDVWNAFSAVTKVIHEKRELHLKAQDAIRAQNFDQKMALIEGIKAQSSQTKSTHKAWQEAMNSVQTLRDEFFAMGKVPKEKNKIIWKTFKEATRDFNQAKNDFYKNYKSEQLSHLDQKKALIQQAEALKDSEDFEKTTPLMKKIQSDWKKIGHVPRKDADKLWKKFKTACNHYFDRINAERDLAKQEEIQNLKQKEAFLAEARTMTLPTEQTDALAHLADLAKQWRHMGKVPAKKRHVEEDFEQLLNKLHGGIGLSKEEVAMSRYANKLSSLVAQENDKLLTQEAMLVAKKITEISQEINQLENNLGFFQHVDKTNPMVAEVYKTIDMRKADLSLWKAKKKSIRAL